MKKYRIQIMLGEDQADFLKDVSRRTGETIASFVRRAVASLICSPQDSPQRSPTLLSLPRKIGVEPPPRAIPDSRSADG